MDWIAKFYSGWMQGASEDGLVFLTYDDYSAGMWADREINLSNRYICEKND